MSFRPEHGEDSERHPEEEDRDRRDQVVDENQKEDRAAAPALL